MGALAKVGVGTLVVAALAGCAHSNAPVAKGAAEACADDDAPTLLDDMRARYVAARSYEDRGTLVAVFQSDDGSAPHTATTSFETAFDRPTGSFRFEYTKTQERFPSERYVVWRKGAGPARAWWTTTPTVREGGLDDALGAMAGVSSSLSRLVPSMLLELAGEMNRDLGWVIGGEEVAGGAPCIKLSGHQGTRVVTAWLDKNDSTLRKLTSRDHLETPPLTEEQIARMVAGLPEERQRDLREHMRTKASGFTVETTIDYAPVFDRPVDPARFEFTPPAN